MLVPALALCAAVLSTVSCGGGIFPEVTATKTGSATPTPGVGNFAYVTDFNTGKVAMLKRNISTGVLTQGKAVDAGAKQGPKGLAIPNGSSFLYVANNADDNVYAYSITSSGVPTPLPTPSFSDGAGSAPEQIAVNPGGTLLWVTNGGNGSITFYAINTGTGELTNNGTFTTGLNSPFGVIVDPSGDFLYVADHGAGTVNSYTINTSTGGLTLLSSVSNLGSGVPGGTPVKLALDPSGGFIYVDDQKTGAMSAMGVSSGVLTQATAQFASSTIGPIGLAIAQISSGNFLLAAYQASSAANIGSYPITPPGTLLSPILSKFNVSAPTGIVVDTQNANAYTADQNDGKVAQWTLTGSCGATVCFNGSVFTEGTNAGSGPFDVILH
jgi:6-phosphogluconolactonase